MGFETIFASFIDKMMKFLDVKNNLNFPMEAGQWLKSQQAKAC